MVSGAAAGLKTALRVNRVTLKELVALGEIKALRLPMVGPRVWREARNQARRAGRIRQ